MLSESLNLSQIELLDIPGPSGLLHAVIHLPLAEIEVVLVFCHGFRGSKEGGGRAVLLADKVSALGFAAVRFDFSPLGKLSQQIDELTAVVTYCRQRFGCQMVVLGRSMGGSAALAFAATDQQLAGLCLWATPWDLAETFRLALGDGYAQLLAGKVLELQDEWGSAELMSDFITEFSGYDLLANVHSLAGIPLLLIQGADDAVVHLHQARELYAAARQPKELVVIPGGDHQFLHTHQIAGGVVLNWLARQFSLIGL